MTRADPKQLIPASANMSAFADNCQAKGGAVSRGRCSSRVHSMAAKAKESHLLCEGLGVLGGRLWHAKAHAAPIHRHSMPPIAYTPSSSSV